MKSINSKFIGTVFIALISMTACYDIIVYDLSQEKVELLSPTDSMIAEVQTFIFWWEEVERATFYQLEIVEPNFDNPDRLVLDTLLSETQFSWFLGLGDYKWRIRALNEAYETAPIERTLFVTSDTSSNLSGQVVQLSLPLNESCSNLEGINLEWEEIPLADVYRLQLSGTADFSVLIGDWDLVTPDFVVTDLDEGVFYWRVRAENSNSLTFTGWSERSFTFDQTIPATPGLTAPLDGVVLDVDVQNPDLSWTFITDADSYQLILYADAGANQIYLEDTIENTSYILDETAVDPAINPAIDFFYWQVLAIDKAGNISDQGEIRLCYVE